MKHNLSGIPERSLIETENPPVEWLYRLALREGNSKKPIHRIHKWWARRLGSVFRALLLLAVVPADASEYDLTTDFYAKHDLPNLVVLDPFMGGGTSIIEARKCNARVIGVDIDPIAWFVTKKEVEPCPVEEVRAALEGIRARVGNDISTYYTTQSPDGRTCPVVYYFWVDLVSCPKCRTQFEAHPHYILYADKKRSQQTVFCSQCHAVATIPLSREEFVCPSCAGVTVVSAGPVSHGKFLCPHCSHRGRLTSLIAAGTPLPKRLFAVEYEMTDDGGALRRCYKAADQRDQQLYRQAERRLKAVEQSLPFPRAAIPTDGRIDARPVSYGYSCYYQLFNARQLLCMSLLWAEILRVADRRVREYLAIAFSDSLAANNLLCSYAFGYRKLTPLFGIHPYNVISRPVENNVWGTRTGRGSFRNCVAKMLRGKAYAERPYELSYDGAAARQVFTGERITTEVAGTPQEFHMTTARCLLLNRSSVALDDLNPGSVDLVLTDPPYYNTLSYSELSDFYYAWLRGHLSTDAGATARPVTPYREALYVADAEAYPDERFVRDLTLVFGQCRRVLKAGGLMVLTFHHRDLRAWDALATALWAARFRVTNVFPVRSEGKSGFHSTSGTIKWDSVLVCRDAAAGLPDIRSDAGPLRAAWDDLHRWEARLSNAGIALTWADSLSLGCALAVRQALSAARSQSEVPVLLACAYASLLARLSGRQRDLLS